MLKIRLIKKANAKQKNSLIALYREKGWWTREDSEKDLNKMIKGSTFFAIAMLDDKLVGMGRIVSDGISDGYIQDLAVFKEYEKLGIGSKILNFLIKKTNGFSFLGLIAQNGSERFYLKAGFRLAKSARAMVYAKIRKIERYGL